MIYKLYCRLSIGSTVNYRYDLYDVDRDVWKLCVLFIERSALICGYI